MQGQLFSHDFLTRGITDTAPWQSFDSTKLGGFIATLRRVYDAVPATTALNEAQTESELIEPVLALLGWEHLPQINLSITGREDVPDFLLFIDDAAKTRALAESADDRRARHGVCLVEAKRWLRVLDRNEAQPGATRKPRDFGAPSSQMLRYLSRADVMSDRAIKWGMLTNGAVWRLYWQDARSRAEDFFEIDLAALLGMVGAQPELDGYDREHGLKLFYLLFGRAAFQPQTWDAQFRSYHAIALSEARRYEEAVSQSLGQRVFDEVFPALANALAASDLEAKKTTRSPYLGGPQYTRTYLDEVREATLVLLYRVLFVLYAEDRALLPVHDPRYRDYSLRTIRDDIAIKRDRGGVFSSTVGSYWNRLTELFIMISDGDDAVGMPAYNGGLFERARAPLLARVRVADAKLAPVIDALARRTEDFLRAPINYRDLSVSHLGGIYERLLEYSLADEGGTLLARPASFARKVSGSYYTHDDLVRLILDQSVGRLVDERHATFAQLLDTHAKRKSLKPYEWDALEAADPAAALLELKICDPAMGSGHFLVALVDWLADRVLLAMQEVDTRVNAAAWAAHLADAGRPYASPVVARIADIRRRILATGLEHGWALDERQLDDRHIVRRMILKRVIFGVDKNPMAVELAKVALWLHTFTVGAPLSFLDHHLQCGDSLHGENLDTVRAGLSEFGVLFQEAELTRLEVAAQSLEAVADLTDTSIAEAHESKRLADSAKSEVAPIHSLLSFWRALRWLIPGWPTSRLGKLRDDTARRALAELLSGRYNLAGVIHAGQVGGGTPDTDALNALIQQAMRLAADERFFHWHTAFPNVWRGSSSGFDAVIGNPPWDRIKLQEVEWLAERDLAIARQPRAADRKNLIAALEKKRAPLWQDYLAATERAVQQARVVRDSGDYPLLGGGDVNLYSLFVERAQALIQPRGIVGLITPSGIAADKGASAFFRTLVEVDADARARLAALFDFENKKVFFPDVDSRFKFCALVFGGEAQRFAQAQCAFFLHGVDELADAERTLALSGADFLRVNPNTGAAPIFRTRRDAELTTQIYARHPVLVNRSSGIEQKVWPVRYVTMFHMTNDSDKFITRAELNKQGWTPAPLNRWTRSSSPLPQAGEGVGEREAASPRAQAGEHPEGHKGPGVREVFALPLYEGKMVQMYDHRAADVVMNTANLHRPAQQEAIQESVKQQPNRYPVPQYWVTADDVHAALPSPPTPLPEGEGRFGWALGFKSITAPTNMRTMITSFVPKSGIGNSMALLLPETGAASSYFLPLLLANMTSHVFDFVLRQKVQGQNLNWFIVEQLPVIAPADFEQSIGGVNIADHIRAEVLALTYTAHDMADFARDLGHVDASGAVKPPFVWDTTDRAHRMARLDALFMHLYGLSADDADYMLSTFPIVREKDLAAYGSFRTRDWILAYRQRIDDGVLSHDNFCQVNLA